MRTPRIRNRNRDRKKQMPAQAGPRHRWTDGLSDLSVAGDPLAFPHLARTDLPPHPTTVADYARLVREIAADRDRWAPLVRYDALTRWYARLDTGPGYEVWLLSWLPGQGSGLHDHGQSSGVLTVVQGELVERAGADADGRVLRPGGRRVLAPGQRHEMVNAALEPAVSIHLYAPGLVEMNHYARESAEKQSELLH